MVPKDQRVLFVYSLSVVIGFLHVLFAALVAHGIALILDDSAKKGRSTLWIFLCAIGLGLCYFMRRFIIEISAGYATQTV